MKPTIEQLAAHNRLLTRQADNMEAEIERLNAQVDMLRGELANTRKWARAWKQAAVDECIYSKEWRGLARVAYFRTLSQLRRIRRKVEAQP